MPVCIDSPRPRSLRLERILLSCLRLVNEIETEPIRTRTAPPVGIILLWPTKAKILLVRPQGYGPLSDHGSRRRHRSWSSVRPCGPRALGRSRCRSQPRLSEKQRGGAICGAWPASDPHPENSSALQGFPCPKGPRAPQCSSGAQTLHATVSWARQPPSLS